MNFESVHSQLNEAQKLAVDTIDGPLLVIAGPGTGKTQLLSARAANILKNTDAEPGNILCLTFTDKAATNMKDRMLDLIGPEARKIVVKTFHGLGAELISSYPHYFWNGAKLQPAPEIVQRQTVEGILSKRPLHDPMTLQFKGHYTLVKEILTDIDQAKKAGLNAGRLHAVAHANIAYLESAREQFQGLLNERMSKKTIPGYRQMIDELPDEGYGGYTVPLRPYSEVMKMSLAEAVDEAERQDSTKPLSAWKQEWTTAKDGQRVFKDEARSERLVALSEVYEQYQSQLHEAGYFDYADMILEVITQLQDKEDLLTEVQERFSYIMIDEFQDSNDAQFRLAYLIANNPIHEGRPNVMAVGDDDQAIYRFQGAELSNVDTFSSAFKDTKEVVLTDNYRSNQAVLDAAGVVSSLIEHRLVDTRPNLDKSITAQNQDIPAGDITHLQYESHAQQLSGVAEHVKSSISKDVGTIAVIARGHKSLEQLASVLHQHAVPVRYERSSNILEHPIVSLLVDLAELVESIAAGKQDRVDELIATLIVHPSLNSDPMEAYKLAVDMRRSSGWLEALISSEYEVFSALGKALSRLTQVSRELPAAITVEYLLGLREVEGYQFSVRSYYLGGERDVLYMESLSALQKLRSLVTEFSKDEPTLAQFVEFMRLNQRHGVTISEHSTFVSGDNPVELMTAHAAKGLEFDQVYIIDALEKEWSPKSGGQKPPANLDAMQPHGDSPDDYARLLFVAMTRARKNLFLTSYKQNDQGKQLLASSFIRHVEPVPTEPSSTAVETAESSLRWPHLNTDDMRNLLGPVVEDYQLSITHIQNFLDIPSGGPQYFFEQNLLRVPSQKSAHLAYGSAIHAGIEAAHHLTNQDKLSVDGAIGAFDKQLDYEQVEPDEKQRYSEKGHRLLHELIDQQRIVLQKGDQPERVIRDIRIGEARIGGKLDVVRVGDGEVRIIDYKTGGAPSSLETTSKSDGLKARKHRLQLIFYALLALESGIAKSQDRIVGEMVYLESENQIRFSQTYQPSEDDIDYMRDLVMTVWRHIQNLDFPDVSDYSDDLEGVIELESRLLKENNSGAS